MALFCDVQGAKEYSFLAKSLSKKHDLVTQNNSQTLFWPSRTNRLINCTTSQVYVFFIFLFWTWSHSHLGFYCPLMCCFLTEPLVKAFCCVLSKSGLKHQSWQTHRWMRILIWTKFPFDEALRKSTTCTRLADDSAVLQ